METTYQQYEAFLRAKALVTNEQGFTVENADLHPSLFPHQRVTVQWAAKRGSALVASSFGLGKTRTAIELLRHAQRLTGKRVLQICPLGVKHQFMFIDGPAMGVEFEYVTTEEEARETDTPFLITNYERVRDGGFSQEFINSLGAVSLDEAAILGNLGTETQQKFGIMFRDVPYRWCATATPAPNDYRQLLHFAEFLGVMDASQGLTRWFERNPDKAGDLRLMPHMAEEFWLWVASWCLFVTLPSDLGFDDTGYIMPELDVQFHRLTADHKKAWEQTDNFGQAYLFKDTANGVQAAMKEKHDSMDDRIAETLAIVAQSLNTGEMNVNQTGIQQAVLRKKQGEGEGTLPRVLSPEQGEYRQGEATGIHEGVPQDVQEASQNTGGEGGNQPQEAGALRERSGIQGAHKGKIPPEAIAQAGEKKVVSTEEGLWDNPGTIRGDVGISGGRLCDLRSEANECDNSQGEDRKEDVCRSRPRDERGAGTSLPSLQLRDRSIQGQHRAAGECNSVSQKQLVIWCNLNSEQRAIEIGLKNMGISFSSIYGSLSDDEKETRLFQWLNCETTVLISKPVMLGVGVNMQQAHIAIYVGVDFKFRDWIQSVHRLQRFGQKHTVQIHIIHTDAEDHVVSVLMNKWAKHNELVANMRAIVQEYGLTNEALASEMRRSIGVKRQQAKGNFYHLINNDCVLELMAMPDNSVDEIVTSIPFGNHYEYVASLNDFGHNPTDGDFWLQMDFLIPHLLRVLKPGRMACIHTKDRLLYGHQTPHGMMEVDYFTHDTARAFRKHGFISYGEIFVVTDVVRENNSTYRLGWSECCKDGTKMGVGLSEKVLLFRKPPTDKSRAYADEPVVKNKKEYSRGRWQIDAHGHWRSNGHTLQLPQDNPEMLREMDGSQVFNWHRDFSRNNPYNYEQHVAFNEAMGNRLPARFMLMPPQAPEEYEDFVWTDVLFMRTLNMSQAKRRVEKHVCPFPVDIVERLIRRFSNEGETILDPFSGLGTTVATAIKMGRSGVGVELNPQYYAASLGYANEAEVKRSSPSLFDMLESDNDTDEIEIDAELLEEMADD